MVRMSKKNSLQWENNRIICSVIDKTYTNIELPYLKWCNTFIILCSEGVIIPTIGIARAFWKMLYVSVLLCMFGWALHIHIVYTIMDCKGYRLIFKYALTMHWHSTKFETWNKKKVWEQSIFGCPHIEVGGFLWTVWTQTDFAAMIKNYQEGCSKWDPRSEPIYLVL